MRLFTGGKSSPRAHGQKRQWNLSTQVLVHRRISCRTRQCEHYSGKTVRIVIRIPLRKLWLHKRRRRLGNSSAVLALQWFQWYRIARLHLFSRYVAGTLIWGEFNWQFRTNHPQAKLSTHYWFFWWHLWCLLMLTKWAKKRITDLIMFGFNLTQLFHKCNQWFFQQLLELSRKQALEPLTSDCPNLNLSNHQLDRFPKMDQFERVHCLRKPQGWVRRNWSFAVSWEIHKQKKIELSGFAWQKRLP